MAKDSKECDCGEDCQCEDGECGCGHDHEEALTPDAINPMNFDEETRASIQEIQILEQNFEQLLQQKNLFNMEINETDLALREIEKAEGEIFKIVGGQVVIKTNKESLSKDLKHKKDLLEVRMKNIDGQEKHFSDRIEELRQQIMAKISKNK